MFRFQGMERVCAIVFVDGRGDNGKNVGGFAKGVSKICVDGMVLYKKQWFDEVDRLVSVWLPVFNGMSCIQRKGHRCV